MIVLWYNNNEKKTTQLRTKSVNKDHISFGCESILTILLCYLFTSYINNIINLQERRCCSSRMTGRKCIKPYSPFNRGNKIKKMFADGVALCSIFRVHWRKINGLLFFYTFFQYNNNNYNLQFIIIIS